MGRRLLKDYIWMLGIQSLPELQHARERVLAGKAKWMVFSPELALKVSRELYELYFSHPKFVLDLVNKAMNSRLEEKSDGRFEEVPLDSEVWVGLRAIDSVHCRHLGSPEHAGKLVAVEGVVSRVSTVYTWMKSVEYVCPKCHRVEVVENLSPFKLGSAPYCKECRVRMKVDEEAGLEKAMHLTLSSEYSSTEEESIPSSVLVLLTGALVHDIPPGSKLRVHGIVESYRPPKSRKKEHYLRAVHIERLDKPQEEFSLTQEELEQIRAIAEREDVLDVLTASIAPHLRGADELKLAVLLQLFSSPGYKRHGTTERGEIHILIIGDPGTGKTSLMRWIYENHLLPRIQYVDCTAASKAGIAAAVVKDEHTGAWVIEAGAGVLASGGMLLLDELDKIGREDRVALLTLLESGFVSISKVVRAELPAKCSVLAAANPKYGRFDPYKDLIGQIEIPPPLLSRFDLIFLLREEGEASHRKDAEHIFKSADLLTENESEESPSESTTPPVPVDILRKYIYYARENIVPKFSRKAMKVIVNFYTKLREAAARATEGTTVPLTRRELQAMIRLARACARVRLSQVVEVRDAEIAVKLMQRYLQDFGLDAETGKIDIDRIYTGMSKSQREAAKIIIQIVSELEEEFGTARKDEILEEAEKRGISKVRALELIELLKHQGDLFEPKFEHYKTT